MRVAIRAVVVADEAFLWRMLYEAAFWDPGVPRPSWETFLADDHNLRYLNGWGRVGDAGVIAIGAGGESLGAAWYRVLTSDRPGWGFVNEGTPELSIGVEAQVRRRGVGAALLQAVVEMAAAEGFPALSLSVSEANLAARLYERAGFAETSRDGGSVTMVRQLSR